ncbi:MAG: hypothetical protein V9G19_24075 [Tetrasphaera sp.]
MRPRGPGAVLTMAVSGGCAATLLLLGAAGAHAQGTPRTISARTIPARASLAPMDTTAPASPAREDWTLVAERQVVRFGWRVMGSVSRRPGNAHSGTFALKADGWGVQARWLDWQCPTGVNPPIQAGTTTPCVLRRADQANPYVEHPDDYHIVGRVGFEIDKIFEINPLRATSIGRATFSLLPSGTLKREVSYWTVGSTRHKKITWTAPAVVGDGLLGWVGLQNSRTVFVAPVLAASEEYTRPVSAAASAAPRRAG